MMMWDAHPHTSEATAVVQFPTAVVVVVEPQPAIPKSAKLPHARCNRVYIKMNSMLDVSDRLEA
jgi:hypothetical protein